MKRAGIPIAVLAAVLCLVLAATLNSYYVFVLANVALVAIVGIGLNVLLGLTGQVSFGHVGFYALGAYTVAVLTTQAGWSFWPAWGVGALLSAAAGALLALPALRVKGPYLAMITIAFSFIVQHAIVEMPALTGGQNGIMGIPPLALAGFAPEQAVAMVAIATALALLGAYAALAHGIWGAAMRATMDSETAAESIGLNPLVIKTVAFAVSAALAGLAGGLFAPLSGFVTPDTFSFMQSILFVLVVVIGGAGTVSGPIAGAIVVGVLPELLASLESYRLLFFGALLLIVLWLAPEGIAGLAHRWLGARGRAGRHPARDTDAALPALPARDRHALRVRALGMAFGGVRAVSELDLDVAPARVTSLIGPNGAGKTTALNMFSGFYVPTSGRIALAERELQGLPAYRIARCGIARTYQTSQLFGSLSVLDNVTLAMARGRLGGLLSGGARTAAAQRGHARGLLAFCGYLGDPDAPAASLAHVDRRLVEIARALATDPDVLLLDEPAAGLSREDKEGLATLLRRIADAGPGVVVVEHDMALVMGISDHIVVLDAGRRLAAGTPALIQADPAVRQAYLGEQHDTRPPAATAAGRMAGHEMLGIGELVAGYGADPVLHGIDLQVREGEMVALLGANGAGKSTLMRTLAGLHRATDGGLHFEGRPLNGLDAEAIVKLGIVLVPEGRQVFPDLSVLDNIRLGAFLHPHGSEARAQAMLERFPRLRERLHQRAGLLSGGEQQMLALARGLMAQPRLLLLDEPSLGLAPRIIAELFESLDGLRRERMTLLLVDQMAGLALALADRAYVMEAGRIVAQGTAKDIAGNEMLARAYLGAAPASPHGMATQGKES
ncbi:branched-chain amino acid ABC transporter ATP-binding protein/permease [Bordetella genomosp. 11]|uniref:ABC transporter n=1 Tax=Bordetella genomosp. 11 TaxID=1416808 RepID=A0A261UWZ5_9BORD|nr:branched-chain amino acid ABC transporter ATP-binding protein/permease [Bordetella genomosp. 11]OZI66426.1 ABC transporter [Bordetella genomosp. 11]